ncbi:hypothetical protein NP493_788g00020 [Ridgeia piscesae]|uniref:Uncharacterized protein n=1 Tax=Ridgeia piscesae TaxID=27915 RepID=A0AAD9KNG9_RIDPI|nr:hypothetical protein NP493_788g00020 [Ridgeia piscesae]
MTQPGSQDVISCLLRPDIQTAVRISHDHHVTSHCITPARHISKHPFTLWQCLRNDFLTHKLLVQHQPFHTSCTVDGLCHVSQYNSQFHITSRICAYNTY